MIVQTEAFVGITYFIVAENFLEKPTAFGVPLGALLLFFWVMRAIQENKSSGQQSAPTRRSGNTQVSRQVLNRSHLLGEVDDSVVTFSASAMKTAGGRTMFSFTIKLHESGTFFVAAGQLRSGRLCSAALRRDSGYRQPGRNDLWNRQTAQGSLLGNGQLVHTEVSRTSS